MGLPNGYVYVAGYGRSATVARIDLVSGKRTLRRTFSVPDSAGVSANRMVLTPDGEGYAFSYHRELNDLYLVEGLQ